ncbi:hypothetical protein MLDJOKPK_00232 [Salmonella phage SPAsTU]|nr:hypothetical protein STsAS_178 [Salmonella phage STsAS]AWN09139.2 hypothetical protein MLDJOKPK_00232 [Salmonella phage SPAsTU]
MKRVVSEMLTLHTQSLIECLEQYGWMSWNTYHRGGGFYKHYDEIKHVGFEAAIDKVAELITDVIARFNARTLEPMPIPVKPQMPKLPEIVAEDIRIWGMQELYDEHVRMLKPNALITGALNWYLHRFWTELVNIAGNDDCDHLIIWYDRADFHRSLKDRSLCLLYIVDGDDLTLRATGESYADLVMPVVENPMGIFRQGDAWVLTDDIGGYLLDPEDIHSDEADSIDYYTLNMLGEIEVYKPKA